MAGTEIIGKDPGTGRSLRLTLEGTRIAAIRPGPPDAQAWLSAGLIDLQVNGYAGHDLNAESLAPDTVRLLAMQMALHGVTTFVPTLITASQEQLVASLRVIAQARAHDPLCAHMIPYVHIEGPSVSPQDGPRGAHPRTHVRPPELAEFERWQQASGGLVGMVTLSPHWDGAGDYIHALARRGVHVCIGHTHATPEQIHAAADAGATLSTHLGNGAFAVLPRHHNCVWAQLADDRLHASFIADGHHLPSDVLVAMLRAKTLSRSILVSDSTSIGGLAPGQYTSPIGGQVSLAHNGRLELLGTEFLAGSATPLYVAVGRAMKLARLSLPEALALATVNAGRFAGGRGILQPGAPADVLRFAWQPSDDALAIDGVWVAGVPMFDGTAQSAAAAMRPAPETLS